MLEGVIANILEAEELSESIVKNATIEAHNIVDEAKANAEKRINIAKTEAENSVQLARTAAEADAEQNRNRILEEELSTLNEFGGSNQKQFDLAVEFMIGRLLAQYGDC